MPLITFYRHVFDKKFESLVGKLISATLSVYDSAAKNLLPTPAKSHYLFNLRDFSRIIGGICLCVPESAADVNAVKRLWVHEVGAGDSQLYRSDAKSFCFSCRAVRRHLLYAE